MVCGMVLALIVWCVLYFPYRYLMLELESGSLFLYTAGFFGKHLLQAGGALSYASAFLTQFLHFPALGAFVWVTLAALTVNAVLKAFPGHGPAGCLALLVPALSLASVCAVGYDIYLLDDDGFFFRPLLGAFATACFIRLFRKTETTAARSLVFMLWATVGFHLLGCHSYPGTAAMLVLLLKQDSGTAAKAASFLSSAAVSALAPTLLYCILPSHNPSGIYSAGLAGADALKHNAAFIIPQLSLVPVFIILAAITPLRGKGADKQSGIRISIPNLCAIAAAAAVVLVCRFDNPVYKTELKMSALVENGDWDGILKVETDFESRYRDSGYEPSRLMVLYRNLALVKTDHAGEMMFHFLNGGHKPPESGRISLVIRGGKQLYYHYGIANYCFRWCTEEAVQRGWSYRTLKYAYLSAEIWGGEKSAETYLAQLRRTLFHRNVTTGGDCTDITDGSGTAAVSADRLTNDQYLIEPFLYSYFTGNIAAATTPEFDRIAIAFAVTGKDPVTFWNHLVKYIGSNRPARIPTAYQEAALYLGTISDMPAHLLEYDRDIVERWNGYKQFSKSHDRLDDANTIREFRDRYGDTYWYFHAFEKDIITY